MTQKSKQVVGSVLGFLILWGTILWMINRIHKLEHAVYGDNPVQGD